MGWRDLFKGKGPELAPDPRLRWFGKLPTYADYYSSPPDVEWAIEFRDWILDGFDLFKTQWQERGHRAHMPSSACAVRLPKSKMVVLASLQDYGGDMGGRPFPLCFFAGVPSISWPGPTHDRVSGALYVLRRLTDLRDEVRRFCNAPGRFEAAFGQRFVEVEGVDADTGDDSWERAAGKLALADWFGAVQEGLRVTELDRWLALAARWSGHIRALDDPKFTPTLRFPLAMSLPLEVQVPGWLCWLGRSMNVADRQFTLMISKHANGQTGSLSVVARELLREDFLLMTPLAETLAYADDLGAVQSTDGEEGASVSAPATWAEFVQGLANKPVVSARPAT